MLGGAGHETGLGMARGLRDNEVTLIAQKQVLH